MSARLLAFVHRGKFSRKDASTFKEMIHKLARSILNNKMWSDTGRLLPN